MIRGTTPTIVYTLPIEGDLQEIWFTIQQNRKNIIEKTIDDFQVSGNVAKLTLSQEETLAIKAGTPFKYQARFLTKSGKSFAHEIRQTNIGDLLREGVMS
jgi:hypothetical protein